MAPPLLLRRRQHPASMHLVTDHLDGHRRPRRQLDRDTRLRHRRAGRALRAIPRARRAASEPSRRPRARRAHTGAGRRGPGPALRRRAHARDASGNGPSIVRPRIGRYGPYVTEVLADGRGRKATNGVALRVDVASTRSRSTRRVRLLTLPRTLEGTDGEEIVVAERALRAVRQARSRRRARSSREEQLLTLTVEQAEALLAQPKQRRGRGAPQGAAQGGRTRSGEREANRGQGRSVWPVRHGRRDQCKPAARRHA